MISMEKMVNMTNVKIIDIMMVKMINITSSDVLMTEDDGEDLTTSSEEN